MAGSTGTRIGSRKIKLTGRGSYGKMPNVFSDDDDIVQMEFDIHDFANLPQKKGEYIFTSIIKAHDHLWRLCIHPRGHPLSNSDGESVSVGLVYAGENDNTDTVVAKACIRTKTTNREIPKFDFSKKGNNNIFSCYSMYFAVREDIIQNDCDDAGTLTITVELQVATEKRSVWFPQSRYSSDDIVMQLYKSTDTSDIVTFIIGTSRMEFVGHKCILFLRARELYELFINEEEGSSSSSSSKNNVIVLADVDEKVFEILWKFIYTGKGPATLNDDENENEETVKSVLLAANRFGVTELKLYMESILVELFLVPSNAAELLLFADSYTCPLLKEASMRLYASHSKEVMESNNNWTKVKESNDLLVELLIYATSSASGGVGGGGGNNYLSVVDDGNGTVDDVDNLDVPSLRERLVKVNLDVDGSRTMLVDRWKNYLLANDNKKEEDEAEVIVVEAEVEAEAVEINEDGDNDDHFAFEDNDDDYAFGLG